MFARLVVLLGALIAGGDATAQATSKPAQAPTQVMIVGTFHLDNPGRDVFNVQVDDVLAEKRQAELADIATALDRFAPTDVMVEWPAAMTDERYASYRAGKLAPSRNEVVQLGFRLAALRKLERVHGIDVEGDFPFQPVKDYASSHGMAPRLEGALAGAGKEVQELSGRVRSGSLGSVLRYMNAPSRALGNHGFYMDMLRMAMETRSPACVLSAPGMRATWRSARGCCKRCPRVVARSCSSVRGTRICCANASSKRLASIWSRRTIICRRRR
jgi:hypothetical protein